jgi:hypothetical protein
MSARKIGKVVIEFDYQRGGTTLSVPIRLIEARKLKYSGHNYGESQLVYLVDLDTPDVYLYDADAEKLRKTVIAELDKVCAVDWKSKIMLRFSLQKNVEHRKIDRHLVLAYAFVQIGTTVVGKKVWRELDEDRNARHSTSVNNGWPDEPDVRSKYWAADEENYTATTSLIDDTPENVKKIETIRDAMDRLGTQMVELFKPAAIEKTIANIKLLGLPFTESKKA